MAASCFRWRASGILQLVECDAKMTLLGPGLEVPILVPSHDPVQRGVRNCKIAFGHEGRVRSESVGDIEYASVRDDQDLSSGVLVCDCQERFSDPFRKRIQAFSSPGISNPVSRAMKRA